MCIRDRCHGTDTMAYTAAVLSYMIQHSPKPIVLTGSQKPIDKEDTDARINLRDSFLYASSENAADVVIVFQGKVIAGTRAKKIRTKSFNAFDSVDFPELARIRDGKIIPYIVTPKGDKPEFHLTLNRKVGLINLTPGMDSEICLLYTSLYRQRFGRKRGLRRSGDAQPFSGGRYFGGSFSRR